MWMEWITKILQKYTKQLNLQANLIESKGVLSQEAGPMTPSSSFMSYVIQGQYHMVFQVDCPKY